MIVTLRTGKRVNIPSKLEELKFRNLIDWDTHQQRINDLITKRAKEEEMDDVTLNGELFELMVSALAEVTDTRPEDWLDEEIGDLKEAVEKLQQEDPDEYVEQNTKLTAMFAAVARAASEYTEPTTEQLTQDMEFEYYAFEAGRTNKDKVVTWVIPKFIKDIYGGHRAPSLLTWQVVEAKEANRLYRAAQEHFAETHTREEYLNHNASAILTKSLAELAALSQVKGTKIYRPKTQEALTDYIQRLIRHFRDVPAKAVLDCSFFLTDGIRKYNRILITDFISRHRTHNTEEQE